MKKTELIYGEDTVLYARGSVMHDIVSELTSGGHSTGLTKLVSYMQELEQSAATTVDHNEMQIMAGNYPALRERIETLETELANIRAIAAKPHVSLTGNVALDTQILKLLETYRDRTKSGREQSDNWPWNTYAGAAIFAHGKLSRIIRSDESGAQLCSEMSPELLAEEMLDVAHYLLRSASLLQGTAAT